MTSWRKKIRLLLPLGFALLRLAARRLRLFAMQDRIARAATATLLCFVSLALGAALPQANASVPPQETGKTIRLSLPNFIFPERPPEPPPHLPAGRLLAEHNCLTEAMFYEARGEGREGQKAVAEVIFNRLGSGRHGRSLCEVIYEGVDGPTCQFSFACEVHRIEDPNSPAWRKAAELAALIMVGEDPLANETGGATNFHATSVEPYWMDSLIRTTQIGGHIFYRKPASRSARARLPLRGAL